MPPNKHKDSIGSIKKKWALLTGICVFPLFILFAYFGDPGRGQAACVSAMSIALAVRFVWDLRTRLWFWVATAVVVVCHLIPLIHWPFKHLAYLVLLPLCLLDFGATHGTFRRLESTWFRDDA